MFTKEQCEKYGLFPTIEEQFQFIKSNPVDQKSKNSIQWIAPFMEVLRYYSSLGDITVELGVNQVNSTFAFLASDCKTVISVDIDLHKRPVKDLKKLDRNIWLDHAHYLAKKEKRAFQSFEESSLTIKFDSINLLFIDTLHTGEQLSKELNLHQSSVQKKGFIAMHDTKLFGTELKPVVECFLADNNAWKIDYLDERWCGLTILKKTK